MEKNQIVMDDVLHVAKSIGVKLKKQQAKEVLELYPHEAKNDPSGFWFLVIENCIHTIINQSKVSN